MAIKFVVRPQCVLHLHAHHIVNTIEQLENSQRRLGTVDLCDMRMCIRRMLRHVLRHRLSSPRLCHETETILIIRNMSFVDIISMTVYALSSERLLAQ